MSNTHHHRGNGKPPGYQYWSARPGSNRWGCPPGRFSKRLTHRAERRQATQVIDEQVAMVDSVVVAGAIIINE